MTCKPCQDAGIERVALYTAGRHGFCKQHQQEAVEATRQIMEGIKVLKVKRERRELPGTWGWN